MAITTTPGATSRAASGRNASTRTARAMTTAARPITSASATASALARQVYPAVPESHELEEPRQTADCLEPKFDAKPRRALGEEPRLRGGHPRRLRVRG